MVARATPSHTRLTPSEVEALVARLTRVAYDVALRHTPDRPFTDLELSLWRALRSAVLEPGPTR
jgi:hypothetical protein